MNIKHVSVDNLATSTAQEVFDYIANHLFTQNIKAYDDNAGTCRYKFNNLKCAAGCLIPDEKYDLKMDDSIMSGWFTIIKNFNLPTNHMYLIWHLQTIHDHNFPSIWYDKLKECAESYDLEWKFG